MTPAEFAALLAAETDQQGHQRAGLAQVGQHGSFFGPVLEGQTTVSATRKP